MVPEVVVGVIEAFRERIRDADVSGRYVAYIEEWLDMYARYKHGLTDLGASRINAVVEAVEKGDFACADTLLLRWGICSRN